VGEVNVAMVCRVRCGSGWSGHCDGMSCAVQAVSDVHLLADSLQRQHDQTGWWWTRPPLLDLSLRLSSSRFRNFVL